MYLPDDSIIQKSIAFLTLIIKRDGSVHPFDMSIIEAAMMEAGALTDEFDENDLEDLTMQVAFQRARLPNTGAPHIDQIEDIIETVLFNAGHQKSLRAYVLNRERRKNNRPDREALAAKASAISKRTYSGYRYEHLASLHFSPDALTFNLSDKIVGCYHRG